MTELSGILEKYWGFSEFRGSQKEIIQAVLEGRDVVGLMPTGGGKSLCYQVPSLIREGVCIVVSPLIALMEDQLASLKARGIKAMGLYGRLSEEDLLRRLDNAAFGSYQFLYLSPERLQQELVRQHLERLPVSLIAIDEAHCISQWGFDFRPAYLDCIRLREMHPGVPLIALTATATPEVLDDITTHLGLENARVFRDSIRRGNIAYSVRQTEDKAYRLRAHLEAVPGSAIVYVRTRRATAALAAYLNKHGIQAGAFHGGMPQEAKSKALGSWQAGSLRVMVATNAFGMGIDKADVRTVIHYEIPETLEQYYQEAGRAGRDGKPASALLLVSPGDQKKTTDYFLGNQPAIEDLIRVYRKLNAYFGIPFGELPEAPLPFSFELFCETYKLPAAKTYNALEVLDRQGVISLLKVFKTTLKMRLTCTKAALWQYLGTYPELQATIQLLLRTYGGLFDYETPVGMRLLSLKIGVSESELLKRLQRLEKDGLAELQVRQGDMEVHFLVPREDARTIHAFAKAFDRRMEVRSRKLGQMLDYVRNEEECRQATLMRYFGEKPQAPCGQCDVCLSTAASPVAGIREKVLAELQMGPRTSRELTMAGCRPEAQLLRCLQYLLEEGRLRLDNKNQYQLT
ncbi:ATP-dependent DNA helicase RecQ [Robiginitalea sp. SC105]|uniref:RecQ family ATP-dependent DNA helicase n=1 Tax=Robiginitalea sp. SC105 TaxID=2762332 RepID=UPI00163B4737|nr:RecQ family ATP-dependent DNA helicase [Robiginitalea sp. SC105]MBC2840371.1 RecQ family ATP-dependent DNA helicase [Robiginitalea sp. SC105]